MLFQVMLARHRCGDAGKLGKFLKELYYQMFYFKVGFEL